MSHVLLFLEVNHSDQFYDVIPTITLYAKATYNIPKRITKQTILTNSIRYIGTQ